VNVASGGQAVNHQARANQGQRREGDPNARTVEVLVNTAPICAPIAARFA